MANVTERDVEVALLDADAQELDAAAGRLRQELLQLDVASVDRRYAGAPPPGARAVEVAMLGALLVKLAATPGLLRGVVGAVQSWAARSGATIKLKIGTDTIEVTGASSDQRQQLIDNWIQRHSPK